MKIAPDRQELLDLIISPRRASDKQILLDLLDLADKTTPNCRPLLEQGIIDMLIRLLEMRILSDPEIRKVAEHWDILIGTVHDKIEGRIKELMGISPPPGVVDYFAKCVGGEVSRGARKVNEKRDISYALTHQILKESLADNAELRCSICGYHFRRADLGKQRRSIAEDLGADFATTPHPQRINDPLKPLKTRGMPLTELTLDHSTPELGHGWSTPDNIRILCKFCNNGKVIFRQGMEPISTIIASSLSGIPDLATHSQVRQIVFVATIMARNRTCCKCQRNSDDREITAVVVPGPTGGQSHWLVPWNLQVECYNCQDT